VIFLKIDTAFILAAGVGEKIKPFSDTTPKPAILIGNKPIIRHSVEALQELGVKNIYIVISPNSMQIKYYLSDIPDIKYIVQEKPLGTADALKKALKEAREGIGDRWFVIYGDIVSARENFDKLLNEAQKGKSDVYLLAIPLKDERPNDWICCELIDDGVTKILAHARHGVTHRIGGAFIFTEKVIPYLERTPEHMSHIPVGVMPPKELFLEETIAMMIDSKEDVSGVEPIEFIVDVDKPWHILEANESYLQYAGKKLDRDIIAPNVHISEKAEIYGHIVLGEGSKIGPGTVVRGNIFVGKNTNISHCIIGENVSIGDNSTIGEYCKIWHHTSIGSKTRILHSAEVEGVIMDGVSIMHYSEIYGVIGKYTDIGAATVVGNLRFDDAPPRITIKGRKEFPPPRAGGAYIGDYCRTGVNAIIMPGVRIGPYSVVGPGVIVYNDIPPKKIVLAKQELEIRDWGYEKYGW